jgi:hypothetical protein
MKKPHLFLLLFAAAAPAWGESQLPPNAKSAVKGVVRADDCAPIGRTANGELVYSMKCANVPAPPAPQQAEVKQAPPPAEPETERTGFFGMSFDRRPKE